jgi:hydrogenase expression/formation protein HypE
MKITMSHGSGGKASADLMKDIFGKYFSNSILNKMEDAAVLELHGKIAFSTDSFVVTPVVFKGGDIGKLAVCGTVNDLLMMGAEPKYITAGFILEEGLELDLLEQIAASMAKTAAEAGVQIVAGDTKVVEAHGSGSGSGGNAPVSGRKGSVSGGNAFASGGIYINTSGIGVIPEGIDISAANCGEGDAVLLSGNLGDHHACILSSRMEIENNIKSDCACLNPLVDRLLKSGVRVRAMRDVTRGGLATVLNEIADVSKCGIEIREGSVPVDPEVRGFCDILGLDPLYMGNEGKMIAVVAREDAEKALTLMKQTECGKNVAIIAEVVSGRGVVMKTRLGGSRIVDVLYGEGLPRIC